MYIYSSSFISNQLLIVPVLAVVAIQLLFISSVSSLNLTNTYLHHKCNVNQGKYKPGSEYEQTLNYAISSQSMANFRKGFDHMSSGLKNNSVGVTIIYQCRGDSYWSKCRPCFNAGIAGLRRRCPRFKGGIIWFDQCFVEITKEDVTTHKNEIDYKNNFYLHNPNKVSGDAKLFNKEAMALLENLTLKAIDKKNKNDGDMALFAVGEKRFGTKKLYAMVQCTRFIYMDKLCKVCLKNIIRDFPKCCDGKQGGRVLGTSCSFRYELYPFLRISAD